jgi:hypothetical protein
MNWLALAGLPEFPSGPVQAIRGAGYDGIQFIDPPDRAAIDEAQKIGLRVCGSGRVNEPADAARLAAAARADGLECLTLHVGWGVESVLNASAKHALPLYPETHRATIFQDMWRAVQFVQRFPHLRFNGDFSHWYTGSEMVYGDFAAKVAFIRPVLDRVRFLHGRIGNPGCIQVDLGDGDPLRHPYVQHFRTLWTTAFSGFLRTRAEDEPICFAAELLGPNIFYARTFDGHEESDRWQQSLLLVKIARECFAKAKAAHDGARKSGPR